MLTETSLTISVIGSRRYKTALKIAGAAIIIISLAMNEWFFEAFVFEKTSKWLDFMVGLLHRLQILGIAAGPALIFPDWTLRGLAWFSRSRLGRLLIAPPNYRCVLALLPLVLVETIYWVAACRCDQIPLWLPVTVVSWVNGVAISMLLFLLVTVVLAKTMQFRYMPVVSALIWAVAIGADTLLFWFGNTRFEAKYLGMATSDSLPGFVGVGTAFFVLTVLGLCLASGALLIRSVAAMTWASCLRIAVLLATVYFVDLPYRVFSVAMITTTRAHTAAVGVVLNHFTQLQYIGQDAVLHDCIEFTRPQHMGEIADIRDFQSTISHYNLPLGQQHYEPLATRPFRRVIVVFCESLSSFFLKSCNPELPGTATPFLDSSWIGQSLFRNHRTSAQPTTQGLAVTFCSQPNPDLVLFHHFPQSFMGIMRDHGWHTAFFSSATRYFDNKGRNCANAGVQHFFGAESLSENEQDAKYRVEWGMCDRILYRHAKDYLVAHRGEQTFMAIEGVDTHVPDGRTNYGDLEYPATPEWIERQKLSGFLRSVFRMDYDLKMFVNGLREAGLLDEDTLVILTADHCFPSSPILESLPGTSNSAFERIPLVVLSSRALPPADRNCPTSQLDVAPSLLHLLGLPIPQSYWGKSIFDPHPNATPFVGIFRNRVLVENRDLSESFDLYRPETTLQKNLSILLRVYYRDSEGKETAGHPGSR